VPRVAYWPGYPAPGGLESGGVFIILPLVFDLIQHTMGVGADVPLHEAGNDLLAAFSPKQAARLGHPTQSFRSLKYCR
jgi:hypothetical protein